MCDMDIYSASVDEAATVVYCFTLHEIAELPNRNMYLDTEWQISMSHPQLESTYVVSSLGSPKWHPIVSW